MTSRSDDVEHRLQDLFVSISSEVMSFEPNMRIRQSPRIPLAWRFSVAAVAAATMVGLAALLSSGPAAIDIATDASSVVPAPGFDTAVSRLCVELDRSRNGVEPLFRTTDAYLVVVEERRLALAVLAESLLETTPPEDAPNLTFAVIADLRRPHELLGAVERAASAGQLDRAAEMWSLVDPAIDAVLRDLGNHGAKSC